MEQNGDLYSINDGMDQIGRIFSVTEWMRIKNSYIIHEHDDIRPVQVRKSTYAPILPTRTVRTTMMSYRVTVKPKWEYEAVRKEPGGNPFSFICLLSDTPHLSYQARPET
jgi:hypothetical protein